MTQQQPFPYDAANPLLAPVPTTFDVAVVESTQGKFLVVTLRTGSTTFSTFFEEVPLQAFIDKLEKGRDRLKSGIILPGTPNIKIPNQKMNGQGS